ncbi:MAG TPA: ribonuclease HII [Candidatus Bathyarchaeia archaeon]|nr:ribonuclease HII [Candidatus Bathyarchaeia archaeon]
MREIGIDEAGKGPVIGAMFVAGVLNFEGLEELGVKDSKRLSPAKREYLAERIEETTEVYLVEMTASEIDEGRKMRTMNEIMVERFSDVLKYFQPDRAIVDAADVKPERFAANLRANYQKEVDAEIEIISEFKADDRYALVSAASIVAKVHRDRSIRALEVEVGAEIGSGYPADQKTIKFLKELLKEKYLEDIPFYVRKSWKTVDLYITKGYK